METLPAIIVDDLWGKVYRIILNKRELSQGV